MSLRGVFTSHSGLPGERQADLAARVLMTMPGGMSPMLALSSGMPSTPAPQTAFSWIEDSHISGNQAVVTGGNTVATAIVFDDAGLWMANQVLMNEVTGEYVLVTSINADNITVNLQRGFAGTTAQTITATDTFQSIGTAYAEGSGRPSAVTQKGEERTNYVQIFKNAWAVTGTAKAVKYITGNQVAYNKEMCFQYHAEDIERAMLFGRKAVTVNGGAQLRTSNGLLAQIEQYGGLVLSANTGSVSGALSLTDLQNFMRRIFDVQLKGLPNERIAFCGSSLLELIQKMVMMDTTYNVQAMENDFGMKVTKINGFNGNLSFVTHPMMVENPKWQKELYVFHPGAIRRRILRETWTEEFNSSSQNNNGVDADEGYIADELGFELKGAKCQGIYRNIATAASSF
jgi:hypothetical protein